MSKALTKRQKKLEERIARFERMNKKKNDKGFKKPGSMNLHKQTS